MAIMDMSSAKFIRQLSEAADLTSREGIASVFRERAGGVDAGTADQRTKAFYRASGHDWTRALG
jgi:hypothetical protein